MRHTEAQLRRAIGAFKLSGQILDIVPHGQGHINQTYLVSLAGNEGQVRRYILQSVNTHVFPNPEALMENIGRVTTHLHQAICKEGGNPDRESLTLIQARDGRTWYRDPDHDFWRVFLFIEDAVSLQQIDNLDQLKNAARAFGRFQLLLQDFPAGLLHETIADFHHTPRRLAALKAAVGQDPAGRVSEVAADLEFVWRREPEVALLLDAQARGDLPLRVTHNDTKLNNVMLDSQTGCGICVIDLDTVMPGLILYDYGDAIRFGASSAAEDEPDLRKVWFDLDKAAAFTQGFFETAGRILTPAEIKLAPWGAKLMTLECGIRFLTDYLNQDRYFKIHYANQNLVRARTQFKLVADMESKWPQYEQLITRLSPDHA